MRREALLRRSQASRPWTLFDSWSSKLLSSSVPFSLDPLRRVDVAKVWVERAAVLTSEAQLLTVWATSAHRRRPASRQGGGTRPGGDRGFDCGTGVSTARPRM